MTFTVVVCTQHKHLQETGVTFTVVVCTQHKHLQETGVTFTTDIQLKFDLNTTLSYHQQDYFNKSLLQYSDHQMLPIVWKKSFLKKTTVKNSKYT